MPKKFIKIFGLFLFTIFAFNVSAAQYTSADTSYTSNEAEHKTVFALPSTIYDLFSGIGDVLTLSISDPDTNNAIQIAPISPNSLGKRISFSNFFVPQGFNTNLFYANSSGGASNTEYAGLNGEEEPTYNKNTDSNKEEESRQWDGDCAGFRITCDAEASSTRKPLDIVFVLDISGTMYDNNRIVSAKNGIARIMSELDSKYDKVGLVTFGVEGKIRTEDGSGGTPILTNDYNKVTAQLAQLPDGAGQKMTNIADGIWRANQLLTQRGRKGVEQLVVLITDGVANTRTSLGGCPSETKSYAGDHHTVCVCNASYPIESNTCIEDTIYHMNALRNNNPGVKTFVIGYAVEELKKLEGGYDRRNVRVNVGAYNMAVSLLNKLRIDYVDKNDNFDNELGKIQDIIAGLVDTKSGNCYEPKVQLTLKNSIEFISSDNLSESNNVLSWIGPSVMPSNDSKDFIFDIDGTWTGKGDLSKVADLSKSYFSYKDDSGVLQKRSLEDQYVKTVEECHPKPGPKLVLSVTGKVEDCMKAVYEVEVKCDLNGSKSNYDQDKLSTLECENIKLSYLDSSNVKLSKSEENSFDLKYGETETFSFIVTKTVDPGEPAEHPGKVTATSDNAGSASDQDKVEIDPCNSEAQLVLESSSDCTQITGKGTFKCTGQSKCKSVIVNINSDNNVSLEKTSVNLGDIDANSSKSFDIKAKANTTIIEPIDAKIKITSKYNSKEGPSGEIKEYMKLCCFDGKVEIACNGSDEYKGLDLVLVLDRTGSMGSYGSDGMKKMDAVKKAAKDIGQEILGKNSLIKDESEKSRIYVASYVTMGISRVTTAKLLSSGEKIPIGYLALPADADRFNPGKNDVVKYYTNETQFANAINTIHENGPSSYEQYTDLATALSSTSEYIIPKTRKKKVIVVLLTDGVPTVNPSYIGKMDDAPRETMWIIKKNGVWTNVSAMDNCTLSNPLCDEIVANSCFSPYHVNASNWTLNSCYSMPKNVAYDMMTKWSGIDLTLHTIFYSSETSGNGVGEVEQIGRQILNKIASIGHGKSLDANSYQSLKNHLISLITSSKESGTCENVYVSGSIDKTKLLGASKGILDQIVSEKLKITFNVGSLSGSEVAQRYFTVGYHKKEVPSVYEKAGSINGEAANTSFIMQESSQANKDRFSECE